MGAYSVRATEKKLRIITERRVQRSTDRQRNKWSQYSIKKKQKNFEVKKKALYANKM